MLQKIYHGNQIFLTVVEAGKLDFRGEGGNINSSNLGMSHGSMHELSGEEENYSHLNRHVLIDLLLNS